MNKYFKKIKNLFTKTEKIQSKQKIQPTYNNPFNINDVEYEQVKKLGSNTIKLSNSSGIGVTVHCLVDNEWVNVTDYSCW